VIRVNPDIFNPKGGKKRETLAQVMTKLDQVGGGTSKTPRSAEDMNLGAAMQVARRADRGDVGPGYEDANMSAAMGLARMFERPNTQQAPQPKSQPQYAEDPTLESLYAAIGARSRQNQTADTGEDEQTIEEINNQVRRRLAQFRASAAGEGAGFRNGGIVQHFKDGSRGGVSMPDGSYVLPLRGPYDRPGPGYDPMAYTGTVLGQPDMPPADEPMTGAQLLSALLSRIQTGSIPSENPIGILPPTSVMTNLPFGRNPLSSTKGEPSGLNFENPFSLTGEPARDC
jgi:hypothetical protein